MRLDIFAANVTVDDTVRAYVERRVGSALGRLGRRVTRVQVILADLNGPRGGIDKRCRVVASLLRLGWVAVDHRAAGWVAAIHGAAGRLVRRMRRRLGLRRRTRRRARLLPCLNMGGAVRFADTRTQEYDEIDRQFYLDGQGDA
jgi:hypothetical protein